MKTTVVCVFVKGNVPFTADYVTRLQSMVKRHLALPHDFVCLTDRPQLLPQEMKKLEIRLAPGCFGWWAKLELFNPALPLRGRLLYLDLDVLVVASLEPVVGFSAQFALIPPAGNFQGRNGLRTVRRYNSSVMVLDAGVHSELYSRWSPRVASILWGDQDFIGELLPNESVMPLEWFPRLSETKPPWPKEAKVILCKKPKNHVAAARWSWFEREWQ